MWPALIEMLVQVLVKWAIQLLGSPPDNAAVHYVVREVLSELDKFVPAWLKPSEDELEALVVAAVEKLLGKKS